MIFLTKGLLEIEDKSQLEFVLNRMWQPLTVEQTQELLKKNGFKLTGRNEFDEKGKNLLFLTYEKKNIRIENKLKQYGPILFDLRVEINCYGKTLKFSFVPQGVSADQKQAMYIKVPCPITSDPASNMLSLPGWYDFLKEYKFQNVKSFMPLFDFYKMESTRGYEISEKTEMSGDFDNQPTDEEE